ncbi:hypothetical protein BJ170DRAFT_600511, partial [Xylariales sp. AK1849]
MTVAHCILQLDRDGDSWDQHDEKSIWRKFSSVTQWNPNIHDRRSVDEIERGIIPSALAFQVQPLKVLTRLRIAFLSSYDELEDLSLDNVDQLCDRILVKSQGSSFGFDWCCKNSRTRIRMKTSRRYCRKYPTISTKCDPDGVGQLVFIDQASRVHMIHETAREFILAENLDSSLAVRKGDRHGHLAFLLCRYLATDVLKMPQGLKPNRSAKLSSVLDISLLGYAANFFSEHLYRSNSQDEAPMSELCKLLRGNILYWFELIARGGDLQPISRTAINLAGYLRRRTKYVPPVDKNIQTVDAWATDCIRVSARFRSKLLGCPSSIHCLIPPFCPTDSIISTLFTTPTRSLIVKGARQLDWDDCLIRIDFQKGQTTTVAHGTAYFAVGMSTGQVSLYHSASIQHVSIMRHPERVRLLVFSGDERYLASGGQKHIVVWEPTSGLQVWSFKLAAPPLAMSFSSPEILVHANRANQIIT